MSKIVALATAFIVAVLIPVWSSGAAETPAPAAQPAAQAGEKEAPELAALVKEGKLPPLEQRIPKNPLVVEPLSEPGRYGGTIRRAWLGMSDNSNVQRWATQRLVRFTPDVNDIKLNLAEKLDVSEGGRVFTFTLREGARWSDGAPFTADDLLFYYEDMLLNKEITPRPPAWLVVGGELVKIEKVDAYVVRFRFAKPYGTFLQELAASAGYGIFHPKHYLSQFHPRYVAKEELDRKAKEAGFDAWVKLFNDKNGGGNWFLYPGRPTLDPWIATTPPTSARLVMERNPYFFKVDSRGRQLPYIDRITFELVQNTEIVNLKAMAGELDFQLRHIEPTKFTLLKENEAKGNYRVLNHLRDLEQDCIISINLTTKDPGLRQVVSDPRLRKALSFAINRKEINDLAYQGLAGEPSQTEPFPESKWHLPELAKAYVEYSPAKANALLDEMGLTKRDSAGFRLRPDGKTLALTIEFAQLFNWSDVLELVKGYWDAVGVKTAIKPIDRSLWQQRYQANEMEVSVWTGTAGVMPLTWPRYYVPTGGQVLWAPAWQEWYESGGKKGEEPPEYMKKACALYDQIKVTTDEAEQVRLFKEILKLKVDYLWDIGLLSPPPPVIGVVSRNLRNVPEKSVYSDIARAPGSYLPEQFFYAK